MQERFIICGLARIGSNIAHELHIAAQPFVAIEASQAAVDVFRMHDKRNEDARALVADASEDDVLLKAGLTSARGVFAATGEHSRNVLIALPARQLNPQVRVVARVHEVRNADKCRRAGADEIVSPDFQGALRMSSAMLQPHAGGFFEELRGGRMRCAWSICAHVGGRCGAAAGRSAAARHRVPRRRTADGGPG